MKAAHQHGWWSVVSAWTVPRASLERLIAAVFVVAVLVPYLSPLPIPGMDVQPVAMALAPLLIMSRWLVGDGRLVRAEWGLLAIGLGSLIYCLPYRFDGVAEYVRVCAPLAIGAVIVIALVRALKLVSPSIVLLVAIAYLGGAIVQLVLPGLYGAAIAPFLWEVRFDPNSMRGPNGLAVEPSMVGNVCALFIAVPSIYREEWWRSRPGLGVALRVVASVTAVLTASVTGVLSCLVVALALYFRELDARIVWRAVVVGIATVIGGLLVAKLEPSGRIGDLVAGVGENPLWILTELSIVLRYAGGLVALSNLVSSPFGDGVGQLTPEIVDSGVALWANLLGWSSYYIGAVAAYIEATASGLSSLVIRMGVFGIAAVVYVFSLVYRGRHGLVRVILVATMLLNVSLATPFVWFVIAIGILAAVNDGHAGLRTRARL